MPLKTKKRYHSIFFCKLLICQVVHVGLLDTLYLCCNLSWVYQQNALTPSANKQIMLADTRVNWDYTPIYLIKWISFLLLLSLWTFLFNYNNNGNNLKPYHKWVQEARWKRKQKKKKKKKKYKKQKTKQNKKIPLPVTKQNKTKQKQKTNRSTPPPKKKRA